MGTPAQRCGNRALDPVKELQRIWGAALGLQEVGARDDFFDLGGDSLAAAQIVVETQRAFGARFPVSVLLTARTIEALARLLGQGEVSVSPSNLVALQPHGSRPPFFCVHGVGGDVLGFGPLASSLAPEQPFYGIRALHDDEHPAAQRIEDMASCYLAGIRAAQPAGPYYLGGFSLGGSVALEMAQQLHCVGENVALLAILDHTPPPLRYRRFVSTPALPFAFAANAARWLYEDIWRAGRGKRLSALGQKARAARHQFSLAFRRGGSGKSDAEAVFGLSGIPAPFRRRLEAHYQALRQYVPEPYAGPVTLFRARTRPLFRLHGHDLGWRRLAKGGLEVVPIPGNHETILSEPNVRVLAAALLARLRAARRRPGMHATASASPPAQTPEGKVISSREQA